MRRRALAALRRRLVRLEQVAVALGLVRRCAWCERLFGVRTSSAGDSRTSSTSRLLRKELLSCGEVAQSRQHSAWYTSTLCGQNPDFTGCERNERGRKARASPPRFTATALLLPLFCYFFLPPPVLVVVVVELFTSMFPPLIGAIANDGLPEPPTKPMVKPNSSGGVAVLTFPLPLSMK